MNVNAVSNVNLYNVNAVNANQIKVTNPFLMQNATDTVELSTKKAAPQPKTKLEVASEKLNEGLAKAGEKFKAHVNQGLDKAEADAKTIKDPVDAMATSHVAANTAFIGQAVIGTGAAIAEIAKGIFEAFKTIVQQ